MKSLNNWFEIECRVLENLMAIGDSRSLRTQSAFLKLDSEIFYNPINARLFDLIKSCFTKRDPFTYVDVLCLIKSDDKTLHDRQAEIMENYRLYSVHSKLLESDIEQLLILATLRSQMNIAKNKLEEVTNCPDPRDAQALFSNMVNEISALNFRESKHGITTHELADLFYEGNLENDLIIPTTCHELNLALGGGVMSKSLITVAAGAGVGKTGFGIFLLDCIARRLPGTQSLFFSLEMESKHIWMRHVGIRGGKQFDKLNEVKRLDSIASCLEVPLRIYDNASCHNASDIEYILTTARLKATEQPLAVIVIDYLGLVENRGHFERNDLKQSDITTKLAKLALELNCVVIALSQINRAASARASDDRCPYPSDAADSSGSHRSSTLWLGVDRPELYLDDPCYKNQFVVKCRKNRFGGTFELTFAFNEGTFSPVQPGHFRKPYVEKRSAEELIFSAKYKDN